MAIMASESSVAAAVHELRKELRLVHLQLAKCRQFRQASATSVTTGSSSAPDTVRRDMESDPPGVGPRENSSSRSDDRSNTSSSRGSSVVPTMPSVSEIKCHDSWMKERSPLPHSVTLDPSFTSARVAESLHNTQLDTVSAAAAHTVIHSSPAKDAAAVYRGTPAHSAQQLTPSSSTASPPPRKDGVLLHLVKRPIAFGLSHTMHWVPHYVVVDEHGVTWYPGDALAQPSLPDKLGEMSFWQETTNSRGTRFKKAAVCWPQLLPEDCPQATDATQSFFGLDYVKSNGKRHMMALAARTPEEREAWVRFLQYYIELYLPPRDESRSLCKLVRTDVRPLHCSGILHGEAPRR